MISPTAAAWPMRTASVLPKRPAITMIASCSNVKYSSNSVWWTAMVDIGDQSIPPLIEMI